MLNVLNEAPSGAAAAGVGLPLNDPLISGIEVNPR
jgi:hypothetical protein